MVDFAAHFAIHTIKIVHFTIDSVVLVKVIHLPIAFQSESSLRYFHLNRIND